MRQFHSLALAGLLTATIAASPAMASPFIPYTLLTTIAIPSAGDTINPNPGGAFTAFDISFFDPTTRRDYVADRSNAGVDVFAGNMFLGRVPGFAGKQATTSTSGPDGVLTVSQGSQHQLCAGDAGSLLRSYNITSPGLPPPALFSPINTGGHFRVDEMSYSPSANLVLVANNADAPAFGTLVNAQHWRHRARPHRHPRCRTDRRPGAVGVESRDRFLLHLGPAIRQHGVRAGSRRSRPTGRSDGCTTFELSASRPARRPASRWARAAISWSAAATRAPRRSCSTRPARRSVKTFSQISGSDEIWYDPTTGNFYVTGVDSSGGRVFDIINDVIAGHPAIRVAAECERPLDRGRPGQRLRLCAAGGRVGQCALPVGLHGGVHGVPEPGSLPLLIAGMTALVGFTLRRRSRRD